MKQLADICLLGQLGGESEEVVLEMVLLQSKSVFDTRIESGRLQHSDYVLERSLRRIGEIPTTTLVMLNITGPDQENADSCVGFSDVKADDAIKVGQSFVGRSRLVAGRKFSELCLDNVVDKGEDIV